MRSELNGEKCQAFIIALRKRTSLFEELARITTSNVQIEPGDWSTVFSMDEVAEKFKVNRRTVGNWIKRRELAAKKNGGEKA